MNTAGPRPDEIRRALELLELPPEATATDVRQAYRFLRDLYGSESIATLPISGEMSAAERKEILDEIEAAYGRLIAFFDAERHKTQEAASALPAEVQQFLSRAEAINGPVLKAVRQMHGYRIEEVATETRISAQHLSAIETEAFGELPPAVYARGFVIGYAAFLEVDAERAANDFMDAFERWRKEESGRPPRRRFRLAFWRKGN